MSKVAPAPPRRTSRLLTQPPLPLEAPDNLVKPTDDQRRLQDMNFKVTTGFKITFKSEASLRNMKMNELLEACYLCYIEKYGTKVNPPQK